MVVVDHTAALGGGELALLRLAAELDPRRVELRAIVLDDGPFVARLRAAGVRTVVVRAGARSRVMDRHALAGSWRAVLAVGETVRLVVRVAGVLRRADADVVHTNSLRADVVGLLAARWCRVPVVWHVHDRVAPDYLPSTAVRLLRALARRGPRAVVANSRATAGTLPGVRDLTVVHPGYAPEQAVATFEARVPPELPVVGLVGRISPTKGQLELVRAARTVLDRRPDVRFRLVGGALFGADDYAVAVDAEIGRLGLRGAVDVVGFSDDPAAELDRLSVCVHASPVPEPFGQVVVEAMVRGVPVVATDAGGVPEIVRPLGRDLGVLVPPGDPEALAAGLLTVLDDPGGAERRARAAYDDATRRFPARETARAVTEVWERVAGRRRRRRT
ncbi:glycosyltransferase family 4 protein [Krasilnikoviella flava]|uniref:glycosyltransferase family 4 protein n=1 Tax=Krasilnikoviella flava TaxID=526729 RepID=UPI001591260E|nr:glycosyltransferase family 4 protein [Krasilnikoviella flava]